MYGWQGVHIRPDTLLFIFMLSAIGTKNNNNKKHSYTFKVLFQEVTHATLSKNQGG